MNRNTFPKILIPMIAVGAALALSGIAAAQYVPAPPPPPAFVATTEPVYYEGHAAYWYNNHWYWKDPRGGWNHYDNEPQFLRDHRNHAPPPRRFYEHAHH